MGFNIKEIAQSWIIAANPSETEKNLAKERYNICLECPFYSAKRKITGDEFCKDCGCPISKKIFSPEFDACPQHKWLEVEKKHISPKNKKSIV
jgi:hypothetical protein